MKFIGIGELVEDSQRTLVRFSENSNIHTYVCSNQTFRRQKCVLNLWLYLVSFNNFLLSKKLFVEFSSFVSFKQKRVKPDLPVLSCQPCTDTVHCKCLRCKLEPSENCTLEALELGGFKPTVFTFSSNSSPVKCSRLYGNLQF